MVFQNNPIVVMDKKKISFISDAFAANVIFQVLVFFRNSGAKFEAPSNGRKNF